jgi:hypothetical protein
MAFAGYSGFSEWPTIKLSTKRGGLMKPTQKSIFHLNANEGYKPIHKLFLNGSGRVITPYPHDNLKSWLEDSPKQYTQTAIDSEVLEDIARGLHISPNDKGVLKGGVYRLSYEEHLLDEDSCDCFPFAVFGKIETNGTLSVRAYFEDGEEGVINRSANATVTNYEVEWLVTSIQKHIKKCKCDSATGDQTN